MPQQIPIGELCTSGSVRLLHDRKRKKAERTSKEDLFDFHCRAYRLPPFARQAMFAKKELGREWRFDFCWQQYMLAVEIEGLVVLKISGQLVVRGRHASIQGMKDDMEKYNAATLLGWHLLRFEQGMVKSCVAIDTTIRVLTARGWSANLHSQTNSLDP